METVLSGKSAPFGGRLLMMVGALAIAGGVYAAVTGEEQALDALALVAMAALFGGGLVAAGLLLVAEKGGVTLTTLSRDGRGESGSGDGAVRFRGAGASDDLIIPSRDVVGIRLVPRDEVWGREPTRNWSCELLRRGACPVVVAESADFESVQAAARGLEDRIGVALRELDEWATPSDAGAEASPSTESVEGTRTVLVRRGGPLPRTLTALGLAGGAIGAVLMSQVEKAPIFGFLFGPTLFFLGLALAGAALTGYFAADVVSWTATEVCRESRLGPLTWGRKALAKSEPVYLRLHPRGLVGVSMELVGAECTLVLVGGVSRWSQPGYDGLLALGADLQAAFRAPASGTAQDGDA